MTWQDISTAPKDGSKVILAKIIPASEDREASVWWACMGHWRGAAIWYSGSFRRSAAWTDAMDNLGAPSHWMPVPDPASPQQGGDTP